MLILLCVMLVMLDLHCVVLDVVLHCLILRFADLVSMIWPATVQDRFTQSAQAVSHLHIGLGPVSLLGPQAVLLEYMD